MAISDDVRALTQATTDLYNAVNVQKSTLDTSVAAAQAAVVQTTNAVNTAISTLVPAAVASAAVPLQSYSDQVAVLAAVQSILAIFPTVLPYEVTAITGGVGTGTGGTAGEYALGVTGGPAGHKAFVTIDSTGKIASYRNANPGISASSTAPTYSLSGVTGLTGATVPTATVGTIPVNRVFYAPSADMKQLLAFGNNAGVLVTAPFGATQVSIPLKSIIDSVSNAFSAVFTQTDQNFTGPKVFRIQDALGRVLLDMDQDASIGMRILCKVAFPDGSINFSSFDATTQTRLPLSLNDDIHGDAFRVLTSDGQRKLMSIPKTYPIDPAQIYVSRAQTADNASGGVVAAANNTWLIEQYTNNGVLQLRSRKRSDGSKTVLTTNSLPSTAPFLTPDGQVGFTRNNILYTVPASGGVEAPVFATTDFCLVGDSMTAQGSGYSDIFPGLFSTRTTYISAEGGENVAGIAVSFGIPNRLTFSVTGNTIPITGTVVVVPNVTFLNAGQCSRVNVTCADSSVVVCTAYNDGSNYYLKPVVYPTSAKTVASAAPGQVISLQTAATDASANQNLLPCYNGTVVIRAGRNSVGYDRTYDQVQIMSDIAAMVALVRPLAKQLIICGVTNGYADIPSTYGAPFIGTMNDTQSITTLTETANLNAALQAAYPDNYTSPQANHISLGGGISVTLNNGVTYTVLNTTVCGDGTHETLQGKTNTANLIASIVTAKGY